MNEDSEYIRSAVMNHTKYFSDSLPMIASENLISPMAKEMLITDFHNRYAEGVVGERYYEGNHFVDRVEERAIDLACKLFGCEYADVRPISGTVANMAVYFALTEPGDLVSATALADGGHISAAPFGALGLRGLKVISYPFDSEIMNIDVPETKRMLRKTRPKAALFGHSTLLFPPPIEELKDVLEEIGCYIWYDAAHVLGLIGGGEFRDPLKEGVEVITGSTHKTLPGPQHGIILANPKDAEMEKALDKGVFPGVTSNHHLHAMASLAVCLAEHLEFGREYSRQIVSNARALGQAMFERGIKVLCPDLGFTSSHILLLDLSENGGGQDNARRLASANIVVNKNLLPWDRSAKRPSGIRIGTQELTRIGMKEKDMDTVAGFFERLIMNKESPKSVSEEVRRFKSDFSTIRYCFESGHPAYGFERICRNGE